MENIRVLVVDDSVVIRRMLSDILSAEPGIEVVATAASGRIALAKLPFTHPDVLTLDVEMPQMNGLETLTELRKTHPELPVVMFSSVDGSSAKQTLEALARGGTDVVTKPSGMTNREQAIEHVRQQLVPIVKSLGARALKARARASAPPRSVSRPGARVIIPETAPSRIDVVAIGASTGGPNALTTLFAKLPQRFPVPILIVQHMPPLFTKLFAERLDASCDVRVSEAVDGETPEPGHAYIAPGDYHLTVARGPSGLKLVLNQGPQENSCRPAADVLFRSVAATFGASSLAVVLTGMGQDGLVGAKLIREAGGQAVVQDELSSVVWGMPGYIAKAGLAQAVLPISDLGAEVMRRVDAFRRRTVQEPNVA